MSNGNDTAEKVMAFLCEGLDIPRARVNRFTPLREGLNIDGEDAEELMRVFADEFKVDISRFHAGDYFGEVPARKSPLSFFMFLTGNAKPVRTLRVNDLIIAAERGRFK